MIFQMAPPEGGALGPAVEVDGPEGAGRKELDSTCSLGRGVVGLPVGVRWAFEHGR